MTHETAPDFSLELLDFVSDLGNANVLSTTGMSLLRELSAGNLSTKQLSRKISEDPTLSASLLKLANSAYYGIPNRVSTVSHAVSLLGFTTVRNLVQGLCLSAFSDPKLGVGEDSTGREFGAHSMAVSKMAGLLTRKFGFPTVGQGEAETAGLLHDIGFLLMAVTRPEDFRKWIDTYQEQSSREQHPKMQELEKEVFGFTHCELGAWLAQRWKLPLMIQEALRFHHRDISNSVNRECSTLIQLANLLCNENEMGYIPEGFWGEADPSILRFLESQNKLEIYEGFPHSIQEEIEEIRQLYDYVASGMKGTADAGQQPERTRAKTRVPKTHAETSASESPPSWVYLVPGLPQLRSNRSVLGGALFLTTVGAFLIGATGFLAGSGLLGLGGIAIAGTGWLLSVFLS